MNFTGKYIDSVFTVSGIVTDNLGNGLAQITFKGLDNGIVTNKEGHYSFKLKSGHNVTFVPVLEGYTFNPDEIKILTIDRNYPEQNFAAIRESPVGLNPGQNVAMLWVLAPNPFGQKITFEWKGKLHPKMHIKITNLQRQHPAIPVLEKQNSSDLEWHQLWRTSFA